MPDGTPANPAARLLDTYSRLDRQRAEVALQTSLAAVFGVPEDDLTSIYDELAVIGDLVKSVRVQVEAADELDPEVALEHFGEVEAAFATFRNLGQATQAFSQTMQQTGWHTLKICNAILRKTAPERTIPEQQLGDLIDNVAAVAEQVRHTADLPDADKNVVLEHLSRIDRVLRNIWLHGTDGLQDALDLMASNVVRKPNLLARLSNSDTFDGLFKLVTMLDIAIRLATGPAALPAGQPGTPPPPPPPAHVVQVLAEHAGRPLPELPPPATQTHSDDEVVEAEFIDDEAAAT